MGNEVAGHLCEWSYEAEKVVSPTFRVGLPQLNLPRNSFLDTSLVDFTASQVDSENEPPAFCYLHV